MNKEYIVLDIETTGLSKQIHKITEIAAIKVRNFKIENSPSLKGRTSNHFPDKIQTEISCNSCSIDLINTTINELSVFNRLISHLDYNQSAEWLLNKFSENNLETSYDYVDIGGREIMNCYVKTISPSEFL